MFEELLKKLTEIENLRKDLNLNATEILTLQLLAIYETNNISYEKFKQIMTEFKKSLTENN